MTAIRFVALLRGVNVGKAKRIAMADLRGIVEVLGFSDVSTLMNSGNVVFSGPRAGDPARRIEAAIAAKTGISARVIGRTAAELAAAVAADPFAASCRDPSRDLFGFLVDSWDEKPLRALEGGSFGEDRLAVGERVVYLRCASGLLESRLLTEVHRLLEDRVTTRNRATVEKLLALALAEGERSAVRSPGAVPRPPSAPSRSRPSTSRSGRPARSR